MRMSRRIVVVAVGTDIVVGHAESNLRGPVTGVLGGRAFATSKVGSLAVSGPSAKVALACRGTNGVVKTNTIATLNAPGVFSSGTATDTAQGTVAATSASGETPSTIEGV